MPIGGLESIYWDSKVGLVVRFVPKLSLNDLTAEQLHQRSRRYAQGAAVLRKESERLAKEAERLLGLAKQKQREEEQKLNQNQRHPSAKPSQPPQSHYLSRLEIWVQDAKESAGAQIMAMKPRGSGARLGLKIGDLIYEVDGQPMNNSAQLLKILRERKSGVQMAVMSEAGSSKFWVKAKR